MTSAIGLGIVTAGHRHGWPVAAGGFASRSPTPWLALLGELGGKIETGVADRNGVAAAADRRDDARPGPAAIAEIVGDRLPAPGRSRLPPLPVRPRRVQGRLRGRGRCAMGQRATRPGRAPCTSAATSRKSRPPSGTSTPGGCRNGLSCSSVSSTWPIRNARSATFTRCGRTPTSRTAIPATPPRRSRPRSSDSRPGFRERIVGPWPCARSPQMEAYNANYVGGDIVTGAKDIRQLVFGPRIALEPVPASAYRACTSARRQRRPGAGAHGMCGANAAADALQHLERRG